MTRRNSIDWKNWNEFLERQVLIDVLEQLEATCSLTSADLHHLVGSQSIMVSVTYKPGVFVPEIFRLKGDWTV